MSDWSDTPPTVAGTYWVRRVCDGAEFAWSADSSGLGTLWDVSEVQFGRRIPTNAELGELPGLIEEFAVACRLHELAQLHDEQARFTAGFRQPTIGHAAAQARLERCREVLAKINAILGVK